MNSYPLLLAALAAATLSAQDSVNAIPRNTQALQNAIAGIGKRPLPDSPRQVYKAREKASTCSIPLRTMGLNAGQNFPINVVPAPEVEPMPQAALPSPPCETSAR